MLFGRWDEHSSYGRQFVISRSVTIRPSSADGLVRYLSSGMFKGIGKKIAQKIVNHFGDETLKILDENPQKLKKVPKLAKKTADRLIHGWGEKKKNSEAVQFLSHHGISLQAIQKIIDSYGQNTVSVISANPYQLIRHVRGFGFHRADQIAQAMGITGDAPQRIEHAILFLLKTAEDRGHCYQTEEQLVESLGLQMNIQNEEKIHLALRVLKGRKQLVLVETTAPEKQKRYFSTDLYQAEKKIAESLSRIWAMEFDEAVELERISTWVEKFTERAQKKLSPSQKEAVLCAALSKVFILTGGPGVGKTTTANVIIHLFLAMGKTVALAAPTGRAAQRMQELSSVTAKTIHRLLEWSKESLGFSRNAENPLEADVIIIDESSMLDVRLASSLLAAVPDNSQLIFIGDKDQLPPVGPGNFFRDLIESKAVKIKHLDQIFRQAKTSQIIATAHEINHGYLSPINNSADSDCHFIEGNSDEEVLEKICKILTVQLSQAGYNPVRDAQILTPMNRGLIGCHHMNNVLQNLLNPNGFSQDLKKNEKRQVTLRVGDKVIQTANNYDLAVYNGDIGFVESLVKDKVQIRFADKLVTYDYEQSGDLSLAYAITIHKSQGSEFPVVIIPMTMSHYVMLQRNLIYTALTRAKKLAILIGLPRAFATAARNISSQDRQTHLRSFLKTQNFAQSCTNGR